MAGIDMQAMVHRTRGFSGADMQRLCSQAAQRAMTDSIMAGDVRPISMNDLETAATAIQPSTVSWLHTARRALAAGNTSRYGELADYLRLHAPAS
jgi:SpoVK/Ycf46/Vps4 family AAA+-type ATPase